MVAFQSRSPLEERVSQGRQVNALMFCGVEGQVAMRARQQRATTDEVSPRVVVQADGNLD
jgi:hypothetical protein